MVSRSIQVDDLLDIMLERDHRITAAKMLIDAAVRDKKMRKWVGDTLLEVLDGAEVEVDTVQV